MISAIVKTPQRGLDSGLYRVVLYIVEVMKGEILGVWIIAHVSSRFFVRKTTGNYPCFLF